MTDIPFTAEAVRDGYWEIYHDDSCGQTLVGGYCPKCGFYPDMQSKGARRTKKLPLSDGGSIEGQADAR